MRRSATLALLPLCTTALLACRGATEPDPGRRVGCTGALASTAGQSTHPAGTLAARASGLTGRPFGIRVSSEGIVFVTQQDANSVARVRLSDLAASPPVAVGADPGDVVFTRDGRTAFVSNFFDGTVHVLDVPTGARLRVLPLASGNAYRLALAPDESQLYVTSTDGRLHSVKLTGAPVTTSVLLGGSLQGIALAADGLTLAVSSSSGAVWRVNACSLEVMATTALPASITQDIALDRDGTRLYAADENGNVNVLDAATLELLPARRLSFADLRPFGLSVTPDGAQLYIASPLTGRVGVHDLGTGLTRVLPVGGMPRRIAFDASGSTAVISNESNWVDVVR